MEMSTFNIEEYLQTQSELGLLRLITCGSVDDGKSTLIGRLLYEAKSLFEDQLDALRKESERFGTQAGEIDFALLVDGLSAEREQGITIDVAYRFFQTQRRRFIIADTPGHEQYTRNMATGASTADVAILLIDARQGVLTQTRRHAFICALLGIPQVILAINKMDLVDYQESRFEKIILDFDSIAQELKFERYTAIPLSALRGDNVISRSPETPWYQGPTLLGLLETIPARASLAESPLRFPVQWVNRPSSDFRGVSGTVYSGVIKPGMNCVVLPSRQPLSISRIVTMGSDLAVAQPGQAVTLVFDRDVDASRGDVIVQANEPCEVAHQLRAQLVWMSEDHGLVGRSYLLKMGTSTVSASISTLKYTVDVNRYEQRPASHLELNDIATVDLFLDRELPFEPYSVTPSMGSFILIDKQSFATVAAGMIEYPLRRARNIHYHPHSISAELRASHKGHVGRVIWLTGLSGSGKSTLADRVERALFAKGVHTYLLDGDNVRHGLNKDLGFTEADRVENIRRVAEVARLMADAGLVVLTAFISPFETERELARSLLPEGSFVEVYVSTPLEVAESRDPKGLYAKARRGEIPNFTGIGSPYEPPTRAEVVIDTEGREPEESAEELLRALEPYLSFT